MTEPTRGNPAQLEVDSVVFAEALDSLHEGLQILSPEWRYLYVNDAVARQGRRARHELLGRSMLECYPGIDRTPLFAALRRCMAERRAETLENEFAFEDGRRTWFELRIRPCRAGLVIASLDVTDRKSIERRLDEAHRQALRDLVMPVIRLHHRVLLVPLVGALEGERATQLTESVLRRVVEDGAKVVLFDVAGVPEMDTAVAHHLLQTTEMIRLLGASVVLTGIAPATAQTMVRLGVELSGMHTTSQLAEGIELALGMVGKVVVARGETVKQSLRWGGAPPDSLRWGGAVLTAPMGSEERGDLSRALSPAPSSRAAAQTSPGQRPRNGAQAARSRATTAGERGPSAASPRLRSRFAMRAVPTIALDTKGTESAKRRASSSSGIPASPRPRPSSRQRAQ
jgi:PAS domain S-box-containing protein